MRACFLFLTVLALPGWAELVDRVAIVAGLQAVTDSSIRRQLKLDAFFADRAADFSPAARREAGRRLLDQLLIRREIELSRFAPVAVADVRNQLALLRQERRQDESSFAASLRRVALVDQDLFDYVQWQITLARFIDFRFRPGVQVGEDEIRVYYQGEFMAALRKGAGSEPVPPPLDKVRGQIVEVLVNRKIDGALDQWLDQMRQQVVIRWREEAFQ